MVEDASAGLDVLDGLMGMLESADLNVTNSFAKSSENLLVSSTQEQLARLATIMANPGDIKCKASDCNNGGIDGNTSKCSTTPGKHCDCATGFDGTLCTWNEASKLKAENMVKDALKPMKGLDDLTKGYRQGFESMEALGKDPNMINTEAISSQ